MIEASGATQRPLALWSDLRLDPGMAAAVPFARGPSPLTSTAVVDAIVWALLPPD
jgi:hypothetical protein